MIYLFAVVLIVFASFAPWWFYLALSMVAGSLVNSGRSAFFKIGLSAALVFVVVAYYRDVQAAGLISFRLAGLFQLPHAVLLYVVLFLITFLSSALFALSGYQLTSLYKQRRT